eukprot:c54824_g1_i1 orf=40-246(+)
MVIKVPNPLDTMASFQSASPSIYPTNPSISVQILSQSVCPPELNIPLDCATPQRCAAVKSALLFCAKL